MISAEFPNNISHPHTKCRNRVTIIRISLANQEKKRKNCQNKSALTNALHWLCDQFFGDRFLAPVEFHVGAAAKIVGQVAPKDSKSHSCFCFGFVLLSAICANRCAQLFQ